MKIDLQNVGLVHGAFRSAASALRQSEAIFHTLRIVLSKGLEDEIDMIGLCEAGVYIAGEEGEAAQLWTDRACDIVRGQS
jgi:hypothetical protein